MIKKIFLNKAIDKMTHIWRCNSSFLIYKVFKEKFGLNSEACVVITGVALTHLCLCQSWLDLKTFSLDHTLFILQVS